MAICWRSINNDTNYEAYSILWNIPTSWKKTTHPAFPTIPEQRVSDSDVLTLLETIDDILTEPDSPPRVTRYKNNFLETFMRRVNDHTTQYLNDRYIQ
jgi:hypothetical protein